MVQGGSLESSTLFSGWENRSPERGGWWSCISHRWRVIELGPDLSPRLPVHGSTHTVSTLRIAAGLPTPAPAPSSRRLELGVGSGRGEERGVGGDLGRRRVRVNCSREYRFVLGSRHCFFKLTPARTGIWSYSQVRDLHRDLNDELKKEEASGL